MTRLFKTPLLLYVAFLILVSGEALGEQNYLENGNFDTDVSGWIFYGDEGETLEWDGSLGFPNPGSLRLTATNSNFVGPTAASDCFSAPPASSWLLTAQARREPSSVQLGCGLLFLLYFNPDCSDPTSVVASGPTLAGTDWTPLDFQFEIPEEYSGVRAALTMGVGQTANGACNFDSVVLTGPTNFAEVPTADSTALAVLTAALALAGLLWLRRSH